jgi:hypothetical protein
VDEIGSDRDPKGIIADERDFNEHPKDRKQRKNKRD